MLPMDVVARICFHLESSPAHVFLMINVVRGLIRHLDSDWWGVFWFGHRAYLMGRKYGGRHFYLRDGALGLRIRPIHYSHVLRLVYVLRCECCGARWHTKICHVVQKRLCRLCIQDNFVSNRVLYVRYGLDCNKVLDKWGQLLSYVGKRRYRFGEKDLKILTRDPLDFQNPDLIFIWKPDLERLYQLPWLQWLQNWRVWLLNRLKAAIKRQRIRALYGSRRYGVENVLMTLQEHPLPRAPWKVATVSNRSRPFIGFQELTLQTQLERFGRVQGGMEPLALPFWGAV